MPDEQKTITVPDWQIMMNFKESRAWQLLNQVMDEKVQSEKDKVFEIDEVDKVAAEAQRIKVKHYQELRDYIETKINNTINSKPKRR